MSAKLRLTFALLLLAVFLGLLIAMNLSDSDAENTGPPTDWISRVQVDAETCRDCHTEIYDQWYASQHRKGFTNPDVVKLSHEYEDKNCIPCHAPRPVFELGLSEASRARSGYRQQGISCLTCHLIPKSTARDGIPRLAGTKDVRRGCALPVVKRDELSTSSLCEVCHNQHETTDQWRATPYAVPGPGFRSCQDCHMGQETFSPTKGIPERRAWAHLMPGSHDPEVIKQALDFVARLDGDVIQVSITNARAGHDYPAEERSRASDLWISFQDEEGNRLGEPRKLYRFRNPYRGEQGIPRTLLPYGETVSFDVPRSEWPDGARRAIVELDFRRTPLEPVPPTHFYSLFREELALP